ncbi:MAG: excinuclease ABC subunit A, partial [Bacteroidetes bacterium]|nr:excinuclease ABC subunit A [Bacteroidota bacterium]
MSKKNKGEAEVASYPQDAIIVKGARTHNLQNIDVIIPRNKLVVITGVSGSGKSSFTIDTLYAEGQRRYVESLSSYARQFLMRMDKPDVDLIEGICPAIAIEQKVNTKNARSTVGSLTEIYDYLRLLYARVGKTYSPASRKEVKKHTISDVVDFIINLKEGKKIYLFVPLRENGRDVKEELKIMLQKGFTRVRIGDKIVRIEEVLENGNGLDGKIDILIDRFVVKHNDEDHQARIADSVSTVFFENSGTCKVEIDGEKTRSFSNLFELDDISFEEPSPHFFNFNSPYGACKKCEGFGSVMGIEEDLVIPNKSLSIYEGAIASWRGEKMKRWNEKLIKTSIEFDFPIHRAYRDLSGEEKTLLWEGNNYFKGLNDFFRHLEVKSYKIQYRVLLSRYRGKTTCPDCKGSRLRKDSFYVKVGGKSIDEILMMPISKLAEFFKKIKLTPDEKKIASRVLTEVDQRLQYMLDVGLGYLNLNRVSGTLSGGETQRINLTRMLGSNLTNSLYILDEPSIGLHPRDTKRLIKVLKSLRDLGNTVVVVEHEEEIMRAADQIIDIGPGAGTNGGELVFQGTIEEMNGEFSSTF